MKFWLSAIVTLLFATVARAEDYRVVYSPSLALEVFIDDVSSKAPKDWCQQAIPVRIVSVKSPDSSILNTFLPRVGKLLNNQCGKLIELPWQMTNGANGAFASGSATKEQNWRPIVMADSTAKAVSNAAPLDLAQPANSAPLQHFDLPGGCHFRTWWDEQGRSLFIPDDRHLSCSTKGWLEGKSELTLGSGSKTQRVPVQFYQGFPLRNVYPSTDQLTIVAANNQRLVMSKKDAADSWLLLTFNPSLHVWSFDGSLLVRMTKNQALDPVLLKGRVDTLRKAWSTLTDPQVKINVLLVNDLHADLADPAIGAWRTVN